MTIQSISASRPPQNSAEVNSMAREAKVVALPILDKPAQEQAAQAASQEQLKAAVNSVREYIQPINNNLEFSVNEDTKQLVVKIVDSETKEVIRQMPSEEMIAIAKALDTLKGLFVKQQA